MLWPQSFIIIVTSILCRVKSLKNKAEHDPRGIQSRDKSKYHKCHWLTIYTMMLPVLDEFLIESGYTKVYHTIDEIGGWVTHTATMIIYFCCVKIGIYWMHRTLHTNKWLYRHMHLMHHAYKSPETLTPWASIAFHPFDGMLQAYPYILMLPFVPCH
jgi:lathosterol oxidase